MVYSSNNNGGLWWWWMQVFHDSLERLSLVGE